ncbi:hypothetical protein OG458_42415 (plasmid) [Streptomyces sp. NBC_01281]|uniref:hypothetical protein n=1 Tax=Streptomyces sp. NBC_01281 TaxID=2903811 RepID=UPI002E0DB3AD|nr:hypothetical protein OG458_41390 [Streptomyces sp. NBC_01281]WSK66611.1 hypothetical protein OG458_42415 [Streptomyces sp. NBC_01281]
MAGAQARLDEDGVALWLTDWRAAVAGTWTPRRIMALVGGQMAGRLDFTVHPDGRAVTVWGLEVEPQFQGRRLASVMVDALYAAHPAAWVSHRWRSEAGARWWDQYTDPAPERNIHNRPPSEWAAYFNALDVAAQRTRNAYQNKMLGLGGRKEAEYRYGERLEEEALEWAPVFREPAVRGPDPRTRELYGGLSVVLPPALHRLIHSGQLGGAQRAELLLNHVGYGNLPHSAGWNVARAAAFEDLAHERALGLAHGGDATHLVFRVRLAAGQDVPSHDLRATWLTFVRSPGIEVMLTGLSWRSPQTPWVTHETGFAPPLDAAIAPERSHLAGERYTSRFDELGELRPGQGPRALDSDRPFAGREAEIAALAAHIMDGVRQRAALAPGPPAAPDVSGRREAQRCDPPGHDAHRAGPRPR